MVVAAGRKCKLVGDSVAGRQELGRQDWFNVKLSSGKRMDEARHENARQAALDYHEFPKPGKLEIRATKPLANGRDLARAYSPGVAEACLEIKADPTTASRYTSKANLVAVISNGTAVLGLGNIGALASKPVMEGKAVLFKKFANIDCFDIEVNEPDPVKLAEIVCALEPTFGAVNLEDIKAPDCFIVEQLCRERMKIPVFHDDQHGTAIVVGAAATNALIVAGKRFQDIRIVSTGGGAAGIACLEMLVKLGVRRENIWLCDLEGLVYHGRTAQMTPQKAAFAQGTTPATLAEVIQGADLFLGLSGPGVLTPAMVQAMAPSPIIFALANPTPEILPDEVRKVAPTAIIATGRSDFPLHLSWRAGCGGDHDQRCDGTGLHRRHCRPGPRHHQRRGRRRLPQRDPVLRGRLPDPETL